jgi:hypothetical protein
MIGLVGGRLGASAAGGASGRVAVAHGVVNAAFRAGFVTIWCDHTVPGPYQLTGGLTHDGSAGGGPVIVSRGWLL